MTRLEEALAELRHLVDVLDKMAATLDVERPPRVTARAREIIARGDRAGR